MHSSIIILVSYLVWMMAAYADLSGTVTDRDHGKIIHFHRLKSVLFMNIPYIHKGIVFFPSKCNQAHLGIDSVKIASPDEPHVIHLWGTPSKSSAVVRIDPLKDVVLGDPYEILPEFGNCLPSEACVRRALSQVGEKHRGLRYNLMGNNCGNFAAWAKLGLSEADTQFWDHLEDVVESTHSSFLMKSAKWLKNKVRRHYIKRDPEYQRGVPPEAPIVRV